jgi:phosphatidylinositol alpha-1,6-mannosyltransferase
MRVLLTTPDFPPRRGGIQLLLHRLVEHLPGHDLHVVTLDDPGSADLDRELPAAVRRVPRAASHRVSVARLNAATVTRGLRLRPDVVLSGHIVTGPSALALARVRGSAVVQYAYAKELAARPALAGRIVSRADATIAISTHTAAIVESLGAPSERVRLVLPGVDPPASLSAADRAAEPPTVLTVARLVDRYKGFDVMLRAMPLVRARVPGAQWVVVGDGPLRDELEGTVARWGLESVVRFAGAVGDSERDGWMARAHVFAMPSRVPPGAAGGEGFGIVYLEAGHAGLPVVAANEGGSLDAVQDGRSGLLVDPRDHVAVADAIVELLRSPEHANALGEGGRARAAALSWERMGRAVSEVLEDVGRARR